MFIDGRTLNGQNIEATLCIIGGGAAGIAIACQFIGSATSVVIVESGGLERDEKNQALYNGTTTGIRYNLHTTRLRYFGGSSNHWWGYCAPLNEIDFTERPWVAHSGWPITRDELTPYYDQAADFLDLSSEKNPLFSYSIPGLPAPPELTLQGWRMAHNLRIGTNTHAALEDAHNIRVLLNSNITSIHSTPTLSQVTTLDAATLEGQRFGVKAKYYILACGGIENARLLLLSRDQIAAGLGNQNDLVGRFFMDHPHDSMAAQLYGFRIPEDIKTYFLPHTKKELKHILRRNLTPSAYLMEKEKLLNGSVSLTRDKISEPVSLPPIAQLMAKAQGCKEKDIVSLHLYTRAEQSPNPDSRVTLSDHARDALGQPEANLNWKLTEQDWQSIKRLSVLSSEYFSSLGMGVVQLAEWLQEYKGWPEKTHGGCHHMGTTRMSDDPKKGVVDRDCRVHGMENLYIAGSSVFPTSGWANPTYTIVALAMRMSKHLKMVLKA